jgi:hypothetical protein
MWPDSARRANDLRERAEIFKQQHFERTCTALLELAETIEKGTRVNSDDVVQILSTYRDEYAKGEPDFLRLYDCIECILIDSINRLKESFGKHLDEMLPRLQIINNAVSISGRFSALILRAKPKPTDEELILAFCPTYLWIVEGIYDETCKLLYVLHKASLGQVIPVVKIEELLLRDIRDELRRLTWGRSEILFLGWEDGHIRNAIAHMHLKFNESTNKMQFIDKKFEKELSLAECSKYYNLVLGVSIIFNHLMILFKARDMAMATNPFSTESMNSKTERDNT